MGEGPLTHVLHGAVVGVVLYLLMTYLLKQSHTKALTRSVLIGLLAAAYMVVFGHQLPTKINRNL